MDKASKTRMAWFVKNYIKGGRVLDVGSYDVNGTYKDLFSELSCEYIGADICEGPNVDVVLEDPYCWTAFEDESFDYIISGNALEHIEFPWLTMEQMTKKLKKGGILCVVAPSGGYEHRYPLDCYRYYGDGFSALAKHCGLEIISTSVAGIPERGVSDDWNSICNETQLIARKPSGDELDHQQNYPILLFERRLNYADENKNKFDFLSRYILYKNRKDMWSQLFTDHHIGRVFLYGYKYMGRILCDDFMDMTEGVDICIIDRIPERLSNQYSWFMEGDRIDFRDTDILLITELDFNRDKKIQLSALYPDVRIEYVDDIFEGFLIKDVLDIRDKESFIALKERTADYPRTYIVGAGDYGLKTAELLEKNHIDWTEYIDREKEGTIGGKIVQNYAIHENESAYFVISSPKNATEMIENLMLMGIKSNQIAVIRNEELLL